MSGRSTIDVAAKPIHGHYRSMHVLTVAVGGAITAFGIHHAVGVAVMSATRRLAIVII